MIEAQAMGRPVVAEDGGGAAETMRAGVTGLLAPAGNAAEMAKALDTAVSLSAPRRAELARAAQDHVRTRYALAESNSKLVEIYQRLSEKTS
jgi:glycosyltransferase involved in cell wall biosynthesis